MFREITFTATGWTDVRTTRKTAGRQNKKQRGDRGSSKICRVTQVIIEATQSADAGRHPVNDEREIIRDAEEDKRHVASLNQGQHLIYVYVRADKCFSVRLNNL